MSQTVQLKAALTDRAAIRRACQRMNLPVPQEGRFELYEGRKVAGMGIELPGWKYPVVAQTDGSVAFDNFEGHWGDMAYLDKLSQMYVVESAHIGAENTNGVVTENELENGDLEVLVQYA